MDVVAAAQRQVEQLLQPLQNQEAVGRQQRAVAATTETVRTRTAAGHTQQQQEATPTALT